MPIAVPRRPAHAVSFDTTSPWVSIRRVGEQPGLAVAGELDMATAPELRDAAAAAIRTAPSSTVSFRLDLADVTFLDSSGTHVLDAIHGDVTARGWTMLLTQPAARGPRLLLRLAAEWRWPSMTGGQIWDSPPW